MPWVKDSDGQDRDIQDVAELAWYKSPDTNHSVLFALAGNNPETYEVLTIGCTIDAYWIRSTANSSKFSTSPGAVNADVLKLHARPVTKEAIVLTPAWVRRVSLLSFDYVSDLGSLLLSYPALIALALSNLPSEYSLSRSEIVSLNATDVPLDPQTNLTEQQYASLQRYVQKNKLEGKPHIKININDTNWTQPDELAQFEYEVRVSGYGYNTGPVTVPLSLIVLLIYICGALTYLVWILVSGNTATSWDSVGDLVALALNSERPKDMQNTSIGIETLETFRRPVNIRINEG